MGNTQDIVPNGAQMKSLNINKLNTPPTLDGILDEPIWYEATQINDMHQVEPTEYIQPTQETLV